jgi:hypothetical protein
MSRLAWHNFVRDFPETKLVALKKAKPLDGLLRDRPARRNQLRRYYPWVKIAAAGIIAFAVLWPLASSPWPVTTTLRHIASAPNCDFARLVGLAPARRGEPGYWESHDRDRRSWPLVVKIRRKSPAHFQRFRPQRRTRRVRSVRFYPLGWSVRDPGAASISLSISPQRPIARAVFLRFVQARAGVAGASLPERRASNSLRRGPSAF